MATDKRRRIKDDMVKTEDLLAGFDRPGRTPRMPPVKRDFVDYHLDKRRSAPEIRPEPNVGKTSSRDLPTAIIPHAKPKWLMWMPWIIVLVGMPIVGLFVAAWMDDTAPQRPASTVPTTSTTHTSSAAPITSNAREDEIPPPPPPSATPTADPVAAPPPPAEPQARRTAQAATASASASPPPPAPTTTPSAKPPENRDFIREM